MTYEELRERVADVVEPITGGNITTEQAADAAIRTVIECLAGEADHWYELGPWEGPIGVEFYGVADWLRSFLPPG